MKEEVAIIGRGIIGLSIAYRLVEEGYEVKIIDENPFYKAASWNNAGLISPTFSALSPSIGNLRDILKWIFIEHSGIRISFKSLFKNARWVLRFIKESKKAAELQNMKLIYDMISEAISWYENLSNKIFINFKKDGLLEVFLDKLKFDKRIAFIKKYPEFNKYIILSEKEILELEKSLNQNVCGGIYYYEEYSLDPRLLMKNFTELLKKLNVSFINEKAEYFELSGNYIDYLITNKSKIKADIYVIATGAYRDIYKSLKIRLPIIAGRGYAIITNSKLKLEHHVLGGDHRISFANTYEGNLKATGFLELADVNDEPMRKCYDFLEKTLIKYFPSAKGFGIIDKWVGSRPCTPDLMPIIDKLKENLLVCVGHCRIGVCLAPYSSKLILDLIERGKHDIEQFLLKRFL
jgi:D-amino-acid dehydrogenase